MLVIIEYLVCLYVFHLFETPKLFLETKKHNSGCTYVFCQRYGVLTKKKTSYLKFYYKFPKRHRLQNSIKPNYSKGFPF